MPNIAQPDSPLKKKKRRAVHDFLLQTYFTLPHRYEPKEINGFWLVRYWDGNNESWEVAVYTPEAFHRSTEAYKEVQVPGQLTAEV